MLNKLNNPVTGINHENGIAFAYEPGELYDIILQTLCVFAKNYLNTIVAYVEMMQRYESIGIARRTLLPAPKLEDLLEIGFYSTVDSVDVLEQNNAKFRYFTLWSMDAYGVFTDTEKLVSAFYTPNQEFILQEVSSPDDAVFDIYKKYATVVFPPFPYCGGAELPNLGTQFTYNKIFPAPYRAYFSKNCVLPHELGTLHPYYQSGYIAPALPINADGTNDRPSLLQVAEIVDNVEDYKY